MNVTREVILDLLPVYLSGEASPATRTLVEEYLRQDAELAQRIRVSMADNLARAVPSGHASRFRIAIASSHTRSPGLAEVAIWLRNIFFRHVAQL